VDVCIQLLCVTWMYVPSFCVCYVDVCIKLSCVLRGCMYTAFVCYVDVCTKLLCVLRGCLYKAFVCVTWMYVSHEVQKYDICRISHCKQQFVVGRLPEGIQFHKRINVWVGWQPNTAG